MQSHGARKLPSTHIYIYIWVFPKLGGKTPQIIHFNKVFHYFHHPFWGTTIFGNIHTVISYPVWCIIRETQSQVIQNPQRLDWTFDMIFFHVASQIWACLDFHLCPRGWSKIWWLNPVRCWLLPTNVKDQHQWNGNFNPEYWNHQSGTRLWGFKGEDISSE